jgi:hypothetical protein
MAYAAHARMPSVRLLLFASLVGAGCVSNVRPAFQHNMEMLPVDRQKQADQLDASQARPTPETRPPLSRKLSKVETGAATAAAILGWMFSSSENTVVGIGVGTDSPGASDPGVPAAPDPEPDPPAPEPVPFGPPAPE